MYANEEYSRAVNCYLGQNKPKYIVIHETDNWNRGAHALAHAKAHYNKNLSTSVHYYVDDGQQGHEAVYKTLNHEDGSYAVGKVYGLSSCPDANNRNTINIEICVNPETDYEKARLNCVDLVKRLMMETGIPAERVIRHYDAKRKYCPRKMLDSPTLWEDFKQRIVDTVEEIISEYNASAKCWQFRRVVTSSGKTVTNELLMDTWVKYKNKWFYADKSGKMAVGRQVINGETYFLNDDETDIGLYGALMVTKDPVHGSMSICIVD